MNYWLFKSEPATFSIDDLASRPEKKESWDGVRNYQARNFLRDEMREGDLAFFYHSSCKQPGIVGIIKIISKAFPDVTAFDPESSYYDPKSDYNDPRWYLRDVKLVEKFKTPIDLQQLRHNPKLKNMLILRKGNRLSITPVTTEEWKSVLAMLPKNKTHAASR